jgi:hypothetical protein
MVCKNIDDEFTFVCHTENPENIHPDIQIIPLDLSLDLEVWWWKLILFQNVTDKVNIFFDLDIVIQHNITHLKDYAEQDKLRIVKAYWKPHLENAEKTIKNQFDMNINSSVLVWKGDLTEIWNIFIEDPEYFMMKYKGIDSYIYFDHNEKINFFPEGEIYSRLYGYDRENHWNTHMKPEPDELYYKEDYNICIFNGWMRRQYEGKGPDRFKRYLLNDEGYHGFEKYWQD